MRWYIGIMILLAMCVCFCASAEGDVSYNDLFNTPTPAPTEMPADYTPPSALTPNPTATPRFEVDGSTLLTITAVGDVTIGRNIAYSGTSIFKKEFEKQNEDINFIFRNVRDILSSDDLTIANFEGTLADEYSIPSNKSGNDYLFLAPVSYVEALVNGSVEAVTIENNHIDDFGEAGRSSTSATLQGAGVVWSDEYNMGVYETQGMTVAMLSYKTFDYYSALYKKVPLEVAAAKEIYDIVIVSFHWGAELDYYPNDNQKQLAHLTIDAGADLVLGHHSHRINPIEEYNGKYIVYSLGNFSFCGNSKPSDMSTFIFQIRFRMFESAITDTYFRIIPCRISSKNDYNDFAPTPYAEDLYIQNVIKTLVSNGKYIDNPVAEYPMDWE